MPDFPRRAFIVSHTHWDREWYLPYHRFRTNLTGVVGKVLDALDSDDGFECFVLDGQAVALEDHLEVRPRDRERIARLAACGALSIGPWYVLPDEFLVSGEATIRNLLIGHAVAGTLGPVQKVGYMPDSFGHIAQMPQILADSGIDSFIYTRGNGGEIDELGHEYVWRAPDGSEVLAVNQCGGYCNAAGLGLEEIWHSHTARDVDPQLAVEQVGALFEKMRPLSRSDVVLLNNGCDHFPPQRDFDAVLEALRAAFPNTEFVHARFEDFLEALRQSGAELRTHTGELRGGRNHHILSGVWSTRIYLKQANERAQTLLSSCVEPMAASAHFLSGLAYPDGDLDYAWRLLLKNHPHDSICGCSTDEVHREMMTRFEGVLQTGDQLARNIMEALAPSFGHRASDDLDAAICVFNTLPQSRTTVVERLMVLTPEAWRGGRLALFDDEGNRVPFAVRDLRFLERFWGIDYRSELFPETQRALLDTYLDHFGGRMSRRDGEGADTFITIQFEAEDLPPLGHRVYALREAGSGSVVVAAGLTAGSRVTVGEDSLENGFCRVTLRADGTFDLTDKTSGRTYAGLNVLEDTEDVGDEYDYSAAETSTTVRSEGLPGRVRIVENTGLAGTLEAAFSIRLPKEIANGRRERSGETVVCDARARVRLRALSPLVEVELTFDNLALDHRLRVEFPTGIVSDAVVSDGHFLLNERPVAGPDGADWVQPPPATVPQQGFTFVSDGAACLALMNRGLPEIEASRGGDRAVTLSLTLLRCVGWLSRDDFESRRRSNAGPTRFTPEAQCCGRHTFEYAVASLSGSGAADEAARVSARYRTPVVTKQGVAAMATPSSRGLFEICGDTIEVTAVKRHAERDTLVVRMYNRSGAPVTGSLTFGTPVAAAWRTNLLEERGAELPVEGGSLVRVALGPYRIGTLEIEPAAGGLPRVNPK